MGPCLSREGWRKKPSSQTNVGLTTLPSRSGLGAAPMPSDQGLGGIAGAVRGSYERTERPMAPQILNEFLKALGDCLGNDTYAVLGGAALIMLGMSRRTTADIDLVIPASASMVFRDRILGGGDQRFVETLQGNIG